MRLRAAALSLLVPAVVALAACGSGGNNPSTGASSDTTSQSGSSGPSDSATSSSSTSASTTPTAGPAIPADTAVAAPVPRDQMPQATGGFGDKPTITMPSTPPPPNLQRVVLSEGDGPVSKAGDWITVNYLGQVWGGKVFDNSYDRGTPFTVQLDAKPQPQVVVGWDVGLRGVKQGSRVMLSFPPQDGYGAAGRAPDIKGTDTLVFVVDVIKVYGADAAGDPTATPEQIPTGWPTVGGKLGALPTISVPKSLLDPTSPGVTIVAKGHGEPAQAGDVIVQYVATSWDGTQTEQSWPDPTGKNPRAGTGPASFPLNTSSPFAKLIGVPLGSRVLLRTPADSNSGVPAVAWVIDLIAQQDVAPAGTGTSTSGTTG